MIADSIEVHPWDISRSFSAVILKECGFNIASRQDMEIIFFDPTYNEGMTQVIVPPEYGKLVEPFERPSIHIDWYS